MNININTKYKNWCEDEYFDEDTRNELKALGENQEEINDRFYRDLEFGTGGLRGVIGAGTNRMNIYTVGKATQGLANYILANGGQKKGVAIAYDSRRMSPEFALEAALCLAGNGIKVYLFDRLRPTPELSFSVRTLGCMAGIVITASHNPPEYNGYKVYWQDGAQITAPRDREILAEIQKVTEYSKIKRIEEDQGIQSGLLQMIGTEIDDAYMDVLKSLILRPDVIKGQADKLKIVYSPLHGTGNIPVRRILAELGFTKVYVVEEQAEPDGNFPTVSYPNPEEPSVFALALELAKKVDADIVLATDPDADRLGVYGKDLKTGEYIPFTGNMSGALICEYQLKQRKQLNLIPNNGAVVTTIVTTDMVKEIAREYHVSHLETLTGFKFIGEQMRLFDETDSNTFLFGFEESYGCLLGTHARDKDAIVAVMALCEVAAYCKSEGKTICDLMEEMYTKYGYYKESLQTLTCKGQEGLKEIKDRMDRLRHQIPEEISGQKVIEYRDYQSGVILKEGKETKTNLPASNVLYFVLEDHSWCCLRPSGTEPKIKFYLGVVDQDGLKAAEKQKALEGAVLELGSEE